MPPRAQIYIGSILTLGAVCIACALTRWRCAEPIEYCRHLATALLASGLKVTLPGTQSTMSVSYVFVMLSIIEFSYPETVVLACLSAVGQCLWRSKQRPDLGRMAFKAGSMSIAATVAYGAYHLLPDAAVMLPAKV